MITSYNFENSKQQWLLEKAYKTLLAYEEGAVLTEQEKANGGFLSLDGYYAHMRDLVVLDANYLMLPSDEEPLVIDANSRAIKVPANTFGKCAGVVGDSMCEIATFLIDRYFDYVDLATTKICVNWVLKPADKNGEVLRGISYIDLVDLETEPGKLRFGWPMTSAMTKTEGTLSFAVTFFSRDADNKIVYVLNTLAANMPIKMGLVVDPNEVVPEDNLAGIFKSFVQNSTNPTLPEAKKPEFTYTTPGSPAAIGEDDELLLKAQAYANDNGAITYEWFFKPGEGPTNSNNEIEVEKIEADQRFVVELVKVLTTDTVRKPGKRYYVKDAANVDNYILHSGDLVAGVEYYEIFATLKLRAAEDIDDAELAKNVTGLYWVKATNTVGATYKELGFDAEGNAITIETLSPAKSEEHYWWIPQPQEFTITDFAQDIFLKDGKAVLNIVIPEKDNGNPARSYEWSTSAVNAESLVAIEGEDKASLNITTPGWYKAAATSTLNRSEIHASSNICRVLNPITAPELGLFYEIDQTRAVYDAEGITTGAGVDVTLIVEPSFEEGIAEKLLSDKLEYTWYVTKADQAKRKVEAQDVGEYGIIAPANGTNINTNTLVVQKLDEKALLFECEVKNILANQEIVARHNDPFIVK